jgi:hypothetical protein
LACSDIPAMISNNFWTGRNEEQDRPFRFCNKEA